MSFEGKIGEIVRAVNGNNNKAEGRISIPFGSPFSKDLFLGSYPFVKAYWKEKTREDRKKDRRLPDAPSSCSLNKKGKSPFSFLKREAWHGFNQGTTLCFLLQAPVGNDRDSKKGTIGKSRDSKKEKTGIPKRER